MALGQKNARARFVHLRRAALFSEFHEEVPGAIEMLMGFNEFTRCEEQEPQIVFETSKQPLTSRLLQMVASGRKFYESTIDIICPTLCQAKILERIRKSIMELAS